MADFFAKGKNPISGYGGGNLASKSDLTSISESGTTASQAISDGKYFYLKGILCRAKTDIASGATFTENTNYEVVSNGGLNETTNNSVNTSSAVTITGYTSTPYVVPCDGYIKAVCATSGSTGYVRINDVNMVSLPVNTATDMRSIFVRKGAKVTISGNLYLAQFLPLV